MHNPLNITEEQIQELKDSVDAVYMYLDMYAEDFTDEEKEVWLKILETIDPDYYNQEDE